MNKIFLLSLLAIITSSSQSAAQSSGNTEEKVAERKATVLSGLTKKEGQEINLTEPSSLNPFTTRFYREDFTRISIKDLKAYMRSEDYAPDAYIDSNNKIKLYVLRQRTAQEKMIFTQIQSVPKGMNTIHSLVGKPAFDFTVTDLSGQKYILNEMKGKIVVLNFWFVECKPCVKEIPELNKIVEKYKDKGVVFLGIATNEKEQINEFLQHTSFLYSIIPESRNIAALYKIIAYPSHIIIDRNQQIVHHTTGLSPTTIRDLDKKIKSLL